MRRRASPLRGSGRCTQRANAAVDQWCTCVASDANVLSGIGVARAVVRARPLGKCTPGPRYNGPPRPGRASSTSAPPE
eukprot:scaffold4856_cov29-Tisochrysis_lutea.AAC.5